MVRSWTFHITGGALCLDFANTLSWRRSSQPIERLGDFADLASWARQAGVITRREELRLNREVQHHPQRAIHTLKTANELLTSVDTAHIGQCSGPDCRWLWIDRTRNHSRRWCDMAICGNRAKARRHYARTMTA